MGRPEIALLASLALAGLVTTPLAQTGSAFTEHKIGESAGGFGGSLASLDGFGQSVAPLGDLDGDGVGDLLVGAPAELAAVRPGKAWVLFLEVDGRVRDEVEVAPLAALGTTDQFGSSLAAIGNLPGMAGVREVAVGASGTTGGGAVWILSLDASGAVVEERSLVGVGVSSGDQFGSACAPLGDLNGDGIPDLAVGARLANDGGVDAGAVWILLLNANGTIQSQTRISELVGGFAGAGGSTDAQDNFGSGLASPGDVDGDGRADLLVGTPGDDDAAADAGALWMLYLNASGSVKATHKIPAPLGVLAGDRFGASVAALGNLDLAGGIEIAVGAPRDDDGATDRGAAWILFLDAAEMPLGALVLSDTQGAFTGDLNGGLLGASVALAGDLDQDGRIELAVGESAAFAPVAGLAAGALWIVSLVGPGDSVWTGAQSTDWFDPLNWSLGLPGPAKAAVVRQNANAPVIAANALDASCQDLALGKFASLTLASGTETLEVGRNVRAQGDLGGIGDLRLVGDGSLVSVSPVNAPVVVDTAGIVELRGTAAALNDGLALVAGRIDVCEGCRTTVVGLADFGAGLLRGTGTLDVNGDAVFSGTDVATPPTIEFSGDVSMDGAFAPTSGTMVFDGTAPQTISEVGPGTLASFFDVVVMPSADVTATESLHAGGALLLDGSLTLMDSLFVDDSLTGNENDAQLVAGAGGGGTCTIQGARSVVFSGALSGTCMFEMTNPTQQSVVLDVPGGFPGDLVIDTDGTVLLASQTLTVANQLKVLDGIFRPTLDATIAAGAILVEGPGRLDAFTHELGLAGGVPVTVRGELAAGSGGELRLDASVVNVESGGTLELLGAPGAPARFRELTTGRYALTLQDGASLAAQEFAFETMAAAGVRIVDTSGAGTIDLAEGLFDGVVPVGGGVLLEITRAQPSVFGGIVFGDTGIDVNNLPPGTFNVRVLAGSAEVGFSDWSGDFAGPGFDDPTQEALWGANVVEFLVAKEGQARNQVVWRTSSEIDVSAYLVDRADLPAGNVFGAATLIPAAGPGMYVFTDASIVPGQAYRYRLRERLLPGTGSVDSLIGTRDSSGLPAPGARPRSVPPAPLPLTGSSGHGTVAELLDALASARSSGLRTLEWRLPPGRTAAFELPPGDWTSLDLAPASSEPVVLDAREAPLVIRALRADQGVSLAGLAIDAGDPGRPAVVLEDCRGAVLLDGLAIRGRLLVVGSRNVLLQRGSVDGVELRSAARLEAHRGEMGEADLRDGSTLLTAGVALASAPRLARGSRWREEEHPLWIELLPSGRGLSIQASGSAARPWVLEVSGELVDLLDPLFERSGFPFLGRPGGLRLSLPEVAPEEESLLFLRAMPLSPLRGERLGSNALRFRASR